MFALLFTTYAWTACRTVGPGDAGELAVAMSTWGVAHAPGYPLLVLIGNLVSHLPFPGEPAFVLNLLNAGFAALACAVLAIAVAVMTGRPWAGWVAGLALGTSRIFWDYALVVEVFALNTLFAALVLLVVVRFLNGAERGRPATWALPAAVALATTCVTHHPTLVLLVGPAALVVVAFIVRRGWTEATGFSLARNAKRCALAALVGLLPLLYIPVAASFDPPLNWGDVRDLSGFWRLLMRGDFGSGWLTPPNILVDQLLEHGASASPFGLRHLGIFAADLPHNFGWVFLLLSLLGLAWAARRGRPLVWLVLLVAIAIVVFFTRVNAPVVPLYLGITRPFYLLPHLVLAFLAGLGIAELITWSARLHVRAPATVVIVTAASAAAMIPLHFARADMRANTFVRDFGTNFMAGMPERAIVFSTGDLFRNSFHYAQMVLGRRADLDLVEQIKLATPWYVRQLRRRGVVRLPEGMVAYRGDSATASKAWLDVNYDVGPDRVTAGSSTQTPQRPVLAVQFIDDAYAIRYRLVPRGLWSEVRPLARPLDVREIADVYSEVVSGWETRSIDGDYRETSWEHSEGIFYTYALARLAAYRSIADALHPPSAPRREVPALALAEGWNGARRADYLAYRAETWRTSLADSLIPAGGRAESLVVARAEDLARQSLALDPDHLQALQTLAALMRDVPRMRDPRAELEIRRAIVRQRPGIESELAPYVRLVMEWTRVPANRDGRLIDEAEAARRRFVAVLDLCLQFSFDPQLARQRAEWSAPLQ